MPYLVARCNLVALLLLLGVAITGSVGRRDLKLPELKRARELRGWTQPALAEASGVSLRTIVNLESGRDARPSTTTKLADALGFDIPALAGAAPLLPVQAQAGAPAPLSLVDLYEDPPDVRRRAIEAASPEERERILDQIGAELARLEDEAATAAREAAEEQDPVMQRARWQRHELLVRYAFRLGRIAELVESYTPRRMAGVPA
jgi:transcriptional regulator with XRE-family HTH domain